MLIKRLKKPQVFENYEAFIKYIDSLYTLNPAEFSVGPIKYQSNEYQDVLKVLSYCLLHNLGKLTTVQYFKEHLFAINKLSSVDYHNPDYIHENPIHKILIAFRTRSWQDVFINGKSVENLTFPVNVLQVKN